MRRRGYTFVEMLVVLAIIALLMAIVVPQFAISQRGEGLKQAATTLSSALRTARRLAITNREVRALALDIYSIPAQFMVMKPVTTASGLYTTWSQEGEAHKFRDSNVAVVAVQSTASWTSLDVTRTDDRVLNGAEEPSVSPPYFGSEQRMFNPQINPVTGDPTPTNGFVNPIYHLIKFQPTGTADEAVIYLWNIEQARREIPAVEQAFGLSNIAKLGVPPGLVIDHADNQAEFFKLPAEDSRDDSYYFTVVVNRITGAVMVHDFAWGAGGGTLPNMRWDRKKDGD